MTQGNFKVATARKRILALEWEANCEQLRCALGVLPRPSEAPPADLMASIRRARELLTALEGLHRVVAVQSDAEPATARDLLIPKSAALPSNDVHG